MSKRVDRLAGEIATKMLAQSGVAKSADSVAWVMPYAVAQAEAAVYAEKAAKRAVRGLRRQVEAAQAELGRLLDAHGERIDRFAAAARPVRGSADIERGYVDLNMARFGVGLVDREAPKTVNGHSSHGSGVKASPPPQWHPENED